MSRYRSWRVFMVFALSFSLSHAVACSTTLAPTDTVLVAMSDGTQLATDYYLPDAEAGPYPVALARSVYGRAWAGKHPAPMFLALGIAFVAQDTRGRGDSEGRDMVFADDGWGERRDGLDTVDWLLEQPWCNGAIGTWGASALGITQLLLAGAGAEVRAQSILVAAADFHGDLAYQGGVWRKSLCESWLTAQKSPHVIDIWKAHPTRDAFWRDGYDLIARAEHMRAPALHISGWFDIFAQASIDNFLARHYEGDPSARGRQILIMGPWPHGISQKTGDLTLPDNYNFDIAGFERRLFEQYLLNKDTGIDKEPPVHYYTLGDVEDPNAPGNEWRTADTWPPVGTSITPLYLGKDGLLGFAFDQEQAGLLPYVFDPATPVPTHGGQNLAIPAGPFDQLEVSDRADVLKFATPPLDAPIEITGRVTVDLYVSTDAPDTDFTAKLVDIYPDRREILMLDSIQRLKFRNGLEEARPLPPGEVDKITIDLWSISLIFNAGHRIGLHISSSNYPRFEVNPNNGDDFPSDDTLRIANNTLYMTDAYPSALMLPVRDGTTNASASHE